MPAPASFHINIVKNVIQVRLEGVWDLATDIQYLSELAQHMRSCHNRPWGLVVDMRKWIVADDILNFKSKINIQMDRRNQVLECWLVGNMDQGNHVIHFIEKAGIPFGRFLDESSANSWLSQYGYSLYP